MEVTVEVAAASLACDVGVVRRRRDGHGTGGAAKDIAEVMSLESRDPSASRVCEKNRASVRRIEEIPYFECRLLSSRPRLARPHSAPAG